MASPYTVNFDNLGPFGIQLLKLLDSGENFTLTGLSGCGRGSILTLIAQTYQPSLPRIVLTPDNLDLPSPLPTSNRLLVLVHFYEKLSPATQSKLLALYKHYPSQLQFVLSCKLTCLTHPQDYISSINLVQNIILPIPPWPPALVATIISTRVGLLPQSQLDHIYHLSGGNPDLAKTLASYYFQHLTTPLLNYPPLIARITDILTDSHPDFPYPPIVTAFQASQAKPNLSALLSASEQSIFDLLHQSSDYVSKETIAKHLWGTNWENNYSEWAIYKQVNNLTKKLTGTSYAIHSKRSRGYQLLSAQ